MMEIIDIYEFISNSELYICVEEREDPFFKAKDAIQEYGKVIFDDQLILEGAEKQVNDLKVIVK